MPLALAAVVLIVVLEIWESLAVGTKLELAEVAMEDTCMNGKSARTEKTARPRFSVIGGCSCFKVGARSEDD